MLFTFFWLGSAIAGRLQNSVKMTYLMAESL